MRVPRILVVLALVGLAACAPRIQPQGEQAVAPAIASNESTWQAGDGRVLPLRRWLPPDQTGRPKAVILALHGFNDYSNAFTEAAEWWARQGIATYAPDQRGFGRAPFTGYWPGEDRLADDLAELHNLVQRYHPNVPVYWLGESMGGAVVLHGLTQHPTVRPAGAVLVAPAVWGRASMPLLYRVTLFAASYTIPWKTFTGSGLKIQASDNIEMLRRLSRDPLFIKATRVDAVHGLVNLMDEAALARPVRIPMLLLYGVKDEVIPKKPVEKFVEILKATPGVNMRVAVYPQGWHMLLRDLQAEVVWRDIAAWIANRQAALPSGAERDSLLLFSESEKQEGR
ncbi:MAG: alpha/beta hydrolase [Ferrovibrio sp.]|nr:MAG: alpha/beta hydrolase [Ferrovibrio sp.]